ncbi:MAG: glycosyltransferase family 2 protein [Richelia sp. RM2_1_2]|nr:glycosyltransferase family 2 protein [Richelia sp. RM2_1_2]
MISVILNVYKRPDKLEEQIAAIKNQSIPVKSEDIHVWYNNGGVPQALPKDKAIKTYNCNWNTKFHGRFTIPLICRTKYIAVFDDDILPYKDWFKNCVESMEKKEGLYGASGVLLNTPTSYSNHAKFGWNGTPSNNIEQVDLVGHCWFFKQVWTKYFWYEQPASWDNGEDIMFSYQLQKHAMINTYVPPHPESNRNLWSCVPEHGRSVGSDKNASWLQGSHIPLRDSIVRECVKRGWKIVKS